MVEVSAKRNSKLILGIGFSLMVSFVADIIGQIDLYRTRYSLIYLVKLVLCEKLFGSSYSFYHIPYLYTQPVS